MWSRPKSRDACRAATVSSVSLIFRWPGQTNGGRSDSRRRRGRKEPSALAYRISRLRLVSCPGAIATVVDQASRLSCPQLAHVDHVGSGFCKQQLWKRNCAARDSGPCPQKIVAQNAPNRLLRPFSVRRLRKSRAISDLGKSRRFARTSWWRTQSRQTGLRDRARLGNREKHTAMADNAFFWRPKRRGCAFPS